MNVRPAAIPDIKIVEPRVFEDDRGFFLESYSQRALADAGIAATFVQDNHSLSRRHVLRGLHYQIRHAQGKLVRCVAGEVLDVAVDIRRSSPTFGKHVALVLSAANKLMVWIPPGFAHGFVVRSEQAECLYKTTDYYAPADERTIVWSDPDLAIDWQLPSPPHVSAKDRTAPRLAAADLFP
jgi:dTDP-4-dehydrorhamnose 3,5-epimerase